MLKIDGVEHDINAVVIDDRKAYFGRYQNIGGSHVFVTAKVVEHFNEDVIKSYKCVKTKTVAIYYFIKSQKELDASIQMHTWYCEDCRHEWEEPADAGRQTSVHRSCGGTCYVV